MESKIDDQGWTNVTPTYHKCPHCLHGNLENRIKRGFFVKYIFVWMHVKRYQCNSCRRKVYIKISSETVTSMLS